MKKIAIFTMRTKNFGNRLQNYALQNTIEKMGYKCVTLQDKTIGMKANDILKRHTKLKPIRGLVCFYVMVSKCLRKIIGKTDGFDLFDMTYIRDSKYYVSSNDISKNIEKKYDCFIAGSDQIWNTSFGFVTDNYFLPFEHHNKIAYAASFGINKIKVSETIVDALKKYKKISVREETGALIVKNLIGIDVPVLIDPTLLLTREEWRGIEKKPRNIDSDGFVLTYFLSEPGNEAKTQIEKIAKDRIVYELLNKKSEITRNIGPSEFIWLFDHAEIIFTDSFHACVFSFLFNKPFMVFNRNWDEGDMNSRLETLLTKFSLERKYFNSNLPNELYEHDYSAGYKQLKIERVIAMNFLKEALED